MGFLLSSNHFKHILNPINHQRGLRIFFYSTTIFCNIHRRIRHTRVCRRLHRYISSTKPNVLLLHHETKALQKVAVCKSSQITNKQKYCKYLHILLRGCLFPRNKQTQPSYTFQDTMMSLHFLQHKVQTVKMQLILFRYK